VQEVDFDGRLGETIVLQWAPGVKRWVHSGNLATGTYVNIEGWKYVAACPMPPFEKAEDLTIEELSSIAFTVGVEEHGPLTRNWSFEQKQLLAFVKALTNHA
jgi:hypothetical protein